MGVSHPLLLQALIFKQRFSYLHGSFQKTGAHLGVPMIRNIVYLAPFEGPVIYGNPPHGALEFTDTEPRVG